MKSKKKKMKVTALQNQKIIYGNGFLFILIYFLNLELNYLNIILDFYNILKFINYACDFYYLI